MKFHFSSLGSRLAVVGLGVFLASCGTSQSVWEALTNPDADEQTEAPSKAQAAATAGAESPAAPRPFSAPIPASSARDLINQAPVSFSGAAAAPVFAYCNECLLDSSGRAIERSTVLRGDLEQVSAAGENLVFLGWAADLSMLSAAPFVVLVSDGRVVAQAKPDQIRQDVATAIRAPDEPKGYGYRFIVPSASLGAAAAVWMVGADGKVAPIGRMFRR